MPHDHPITARADEALGMEPAEHVAQRDMTPAEDIAHRRCRCGPTP